MFSDGGSDRNPNALCVAAKKFVQNANVMVGLLRYQEVEPFVTCIGIVMKNTNRKPASNERIQMMAHCTAYGPLQNSLTLRDDNALSILT